MKTWQKVGIGLGGVAVLGGIVWFSINQANKGVVTVQTAKVAKVDSLVSQVTASGEVKPTTYTNITAQGFGRITEILVKAKLDYERGQGLYKDGLIPKQDFDQRKTAFNAAAAAVDASRARMQMQKAQLEQVRSNLDQSKAVLVRTKDVLQKTTYFSPINGIVSYLPVRLGEYVVPGIQNATGSFLMTLSDMSVVTSEVKVDETDIVNVKIGQDAEVTIDAIPGKTFKGKVTEIGSQAVLRSSGLATTQTTTSNQEAKDFKVVVTLEK